MKLLVLQEEEIDFVYSRGKGRRTLKCRDIFLKCKLKLEYSIVSNFPLFNFFLSAIAVFREYGILNCIIG